ncbi:MAG: hypothetical protein H6835_21165, partial [Planctomycetes bacterium]|nr:hypothetical protein [Planctomycetota bacterium]
MLLALLLATQVPPPAETPARVIVCGRSTTLVEVVVVAVGDQVPATYSPSVGNTPGMTWYVSQHYALKTDRDAATARRYLEYSELAWPLQVEIVGRAPPDQDRLRMPLVMGSSLERMFDAIETDGGWRPKDIGGGGITYWGMNTAYDYPSGSLQYHQRDLVLHENLHLLHMCSGGVRGPHRLTEGITYTSCNHVYDEAARRLTLCVFDKPTVNMPTSEELRRFASQPCTFRQVCERNDYITLFTSFLWSDPARLLGWREWRDAMLFGGRLDQDLAVMAEVFGPLDGDIERQWQQWLAERRATFAYRDWGWEQDGDTLVAYGWPQRGPYSRTDVLLPPGEPPRSDPLAMDWPLQAPADRELVGAVARGGDEPVIGAVLGFERCPGRGEVGIGLGVECERPTAELAYLPVSIRGGATLLLRGSDLGLEDLELALPEDLRGAAAAAGHRLGLTVRMARERLEVTVRARDPAA